MPKEDVVIEEIPQEKEPISTPEPSAKTKEESPTPPAKEPDPASEPTVAEPVAKSEETKLEKKETSKPVGMAKQYEAVWFLLDRLVGMGGEAMAPTIAFLSARGIPVMGHIGLTPQAVNALGGYGARGRSNAEHAKIIADARAVAAAGAFAIVAEGVIEPLARAVTAEVSCPVIGIGASADCDGQVLVTEDMLGMFERTPRFVKKFDDLAGRISAAVQTYAADVRSRDFPTPDQTYAPAAKTAD